MSATSDAILKALTSAKTWVGLTLGGIAAVAVAAVPLDGRYAKASALEKVEAKMSEVEKSNAADHAVIGMIREDTRSILEAIRQDQWRAHRISIPDPAPLDMGAAPPMGPRVR